MTALFLAWKREAKAGQSFNEYLAYIGFTDPSVTTRGMDDSMLTQPTVNGDVELLAVPTQRISGKAHVVVLLLEFPDRPRTYDRGHYVDLFFSKDIHPTGSVRDYFVEVSNGKVDVVGTVHDWLTMPKPYTEYLGTKSGMEGKDYPNNSQSMAEDAVRAAKAAGIEFGPELDLLGRGTVAGLVLVHAGLPAEVYQSVPEQQKEIWSHKWSLRKAVKVGPSLSVTSYLTVAQNCRLGVCAHELGHLLFQWQDFYDPNSDKDNMFWKGSGDWDLMASGSYNNNSTAPAHPAGLHKFQHGWVSDLVITKSTQGVRLLPPSVEGGRVCVIKSPAYSEQQFLLLEARAKQGFDEYLPGHGLLVWRVDLSMEMFAPATPGMQLVQADGLKQLESPDGQMQGDAGDPFPGDARVVDVDDSPTEPSTSFRGRRSGVSLSNIVYDPSGVATFDVSIVDPLLAAPDSLPSAAAVVAGDSAVVRRTEPAVPKLSVAVARTRARGQVANLFAPTETSRKSSTSEASGSAKTSRRPARPKSARAPKPPTRRSR